MSTERVQTPQTQPKNAPESVTEPSSRNVSFWIREAHPDARWYGPWLSVGWIETHIFDGGCPLHPLPARDGWSNAERLIAWIFDSCNCVAALHVTVSWWWGRIEWWGVLAEWRWIARLHPRYQAPRGWRP